MTDKKPVSQEQTQAAFAIEKAAQKDPGVLALRDALMGLGLLKADAGDEVPLERTKGRREGIAMAIELVGELAERRLAKAREEAAK